MKTIIPLSIALALSLSVPLSADNAPNIKQARQAMLQAADLDKSGDYVRSAFLKALKKPFDEASKKKKLLLIGDSHAQDFYNVIQEGGYLKDYQISTRKILTKCQLYAGTAKPSAYIAKKHSALCKNADTISAAAAQISQADVVILAAKWQQWSAEHILETISNMPLKPSQELVIIGRKSFGRINIRQYMRKPASELIKLRNVVDEYQLPINTLMKKQLAQHHFVDMQALLCDDQADCPVFTPQLDLISFDGGHLTQAGAKALGPVIFSDPALKGLE